MVYILVIWTVVGYAGAGTQFNPRWEKEYDWRPIGEFVNEAGSFGSSKQRSALQMCQAAAQELNLKPERYRCLQAK